MVIACAAWVQILTLPLVSSVDWDKLFSHSVLQFSQMEYMDDNLLWRKTKRGSAKIRKEVLNELNEVKNLD